MNRQQISPLWTHRGTTIIRLRTIKPKEISSNIDNVDKVEIKPSQIDLAKEINKIGVYEAKINLHAEVQAVIHIEVVKIEEAN